MYSDESLDEKVEISVKRIEILKENPKRLQSDLNVDNYLTNFCKVKVESKVRQCYKRVSALGPIL